MNFKRFTCIFILAGFIFISCNNNKNKAEKEPITGKWIFKDMEFLKGSLLYDLPEDEKQEAMNDVKGTTFEFKSDGTYTVTQGSNKEEPLKGTYTIKNGNNMTLTNERHPDGESLTISFPDKNTLRIEQTDKKIALVVERLE
jgi:uncharacterized protein (TIGR03066 family)